MHEFKYPIFFNSYCSALNLSIVFYILIWQKSKLSHNHMQDKVASTLTRKAARLQMLEKKVSILEKAVEFNPNSEELLLCLLKTYLNRDTIDTAMEKWEKILIQHSDSCKLWKEFLLICQGDFSQFKVSKIRKSYAHAIQALSAALDKQRRQVLCVLFHFFLFFLQYIHLPIAFYVSIYAFYYNDQILDFIHMKNILFLIYMQYCLFLSHGGNC